jgi:hypothetical protein
MKIILTIIAVTVGMVQTVARAADEPAWSLEERVIGADSCSVHCQCFIGGPPDNGLCQFFEIHQIDNGRYGDVKLGGVKYGFAGEFARKTADEPPKFSFVAYYIDSGASTEQKEALRKLFSGHSLTPPGIGQPADVKEVAINFENLDRFGQAGKTVNATVGTIAKVQVTPIAGGTDPNKPMAVENADVPGMKWIALGKATDSFYRSSGKEYIFEGTSGMSSRFAMKGGGEK